MIASDKFDKDGRLTPEAARELNEALDRIQNDQKEAEKQRKKEPEIRFMKCAAEAGFTDKQAKFMWKSLALKEHEHWNGMVG